MSFKPPPGWKIYKEQMLQFDYGDPLWEPAPLDYFKRIRLGDVGYVRRGCFHLLFSAGCPLGGRQLGVDVPLTFQPLVVDPIVNTQPRLPGYLSINTVRGIGVGPGTSARTVQTLEPGSTISFELSGKQGAAPVTKYQTYREDIQREQIFEEYTKRHYESWKAFVHGAGHGNNIRPVLVTGVDMTRDFAMMSYSNNGVRPTSEFTISVPEVASTSAWGTWRTEGSVHTNCGPQLCSLSPSTRATGSTPPGNSRTESVSEEYNQCVFVRYYTMRDRPLLIPKVMKAAAGPHDLGPGGRNNEESPLGTQRDSDSSSDNTPSLFEGDGDDDRSSVTSIDSESDMVIHNITADERDDFDVIADYIFRNSDADSALIHHRDIALLYQFGGGTGLSTRLLEGLPPIAVDENGVGTIALQEDQLSSGTPNYDHDFHDEDVTQFPDTGERDEMVWLPVGSPPVGTKSIGPQRPDKGKQATVVGFTHSSMELPATSQFPPTRSSAPILPSNWIQVPQRIYNHGRRQWDFKQSEPIFFSVDGSPGINMQHALRKNFAGLDGRDDQMPQKTVGAISCRLLFPGYPPNCSAQIPTMAWTRARTPIIRSKLAYEVAKKLERYLQSMARHPMDHSIDKRWKIGEGFMHLENMFLVRLVSVSKGSFQPEIWVADTSMHTTHWDRPAAGPGTGTFPGDPMLSLGSRTEQSTSLTPVEMTIDIPLLSVAPVDDMSTMFRDLISHDFNRLLNRTEGEEGRAF